MSILTEVKETVCPVCGAGVVAEKKFNQHCNGHFNERREFSCGCVLCFSPNFMKVLREVECPSHPTMVAEREANASARIKLLKFLKTLRMPAHLADNLKREINYLLR